MYKLLKDILDFEIKEAVNRGGMKILPTSLILIIFGVLYLMSGIDVVPEQIVQPKAVGYVDDLIVFIGIAIFVKSRNDIVGISNFESNDTEVKEIEKVTKREKKEPIIKNSLLKHVVETDLEEVVVPLDAHSVEAGYTHVGELDPDIVDEIMKASDPKQQTGGSQSLKSGVQRFPL